MLADVRRGPESRRDGPARQLANDVRGDAGVPVLFARVLDDAEHVEAGHLGDLAHELDLDMRHVRPVCRPSLRRAVEARVRVVVLADVHLVGELADDLHRQATADPELLRLAVQVVQEAVDLGHLVRGELDRAVRTERVVDQVVRVLIAGDRGRARVAAPELLRLAAVPEVLVLGPARRRAAARRRRPQVERVAAAVEPDVRVLEEPLEHLVAWHVQIGDRAADARMIAVVVEE